MFECLAIANQPKCTKPNGLCNRRMLTIVHHPVDLHWNTFCEVLLGRLLYLYLLIAYAECLTSV